VLCLLACVSRTWSIDWADREQSLCKLCDHVQSDSPSDETIHSGAFAGGDGWDHEWGEPWDDQYRNGGMTAVDACCACGGGSNGLTDLSACVMPQIV
jgi:hypothetical protein